MVQTTQLRAAKKFSPGYFIREQLAMHHWSMEDLAIKIGLSEKQLNKIFKDRMPISFETARLLSKVFETSPQYWVNIDTEYRSWIEHVRILKSSN